MAEYNGLEKYPHVQEKLALLAMHSEEIEALSRAACAYPDTDPDTGLVSPNLIYTNIAKYRFANERHEALKLLGDITGGIASTTPSYKDWTNPEIRPFLEKYLAAKADVPTENRLKAIRMAKELTLGGSYGTAGPIHYEGSLAAQKMALYQGTDWERYKAAAKRLAHIPGYEEHPEYRDMPEPRLPIV
jgi:4-hydroxybutyryl-CoA dehydratase/vinylacetyl-CoA-Delta-isomerase